MTDRLKNKLYNTVDSILQGYKYIDGMWFIDDYAITSGDIVNTVANDLINLGCDVDGSDIEWLTQRIREKEQV